MQIAPYYQDDLVTLYHGDCLEHPELWTCADVLVTDPPYGMAYVSRYSGNSVAGDLDTSVRDSALKIWGGKPAMVFGSWRNEKPKCDQVIIWDKGPEASLGHPVFFSAYEEIYLIGNGWKGPRRPNVISVDGMSRGGKERKTYGHPTPKPASLLEILISHSPDGVIADPFAGSGTTLVAAKALGRKAIGVELEEKYCEIAARRLAQDALPIWNLCGDVS